MKKVFKIISVLLLLGQMAKAQVDTSKRDALTDYDHERFFRIGCKGTIGLNKLPGYSYNDGLNLNYQLGLFCQFNYTKRFGFQPEINLIQATSTHYKSVTDVTTDLFAGGGQGDAKYDFLELVGLLNINLGYSRHAKFQVGPSLGFYTSGTPKTIPDVNYIEYKSIAPGLLAGLWLQLPVINFGFRYHYRFNKNQNAFTGQNGINQAIEIFGGITI